jgi:uncharacterized membrane protein
MELVMRYLPDGHDGKSREWQVALLFLAMTMQGCSVPYSDPADAAVFSDSSDVSVKRVNGALFTGVLEEPFALTRGKFEGEPYIDGGSTRPLVTIKPASVALFDVDGDGFDEATVVLAVSTGGSGTFLYLAVVDIKGGIAQSTATTLLGDRVQLKNLFVEENRINLETLEHGAHDAMCCPTQAWRREWTLEQGVLQNTLAEEIGSAELSRRYKGHLVWGHEMHSFTECKTEREGWVFDVAQLGLDEVVQQLAVEPYQPLFVEVVGIWTPAPRDGFAADFDEALSVIQLLRAEREGFGCDENLDGVIYRARGNEPSWRLDVRKDAMEFSSMSGNAVFLSPEVTTMDDSVRIAANTDGKAIDVTITAGRCTDAMSGSIYAFTSMVAMGELQFSGCAIGGF